MKKSYVVVMKHVLNICEQVIKFRFWFYFPLAKKVAQFTVHVMEKENRKLFVGLNNLQQTKRPYTSRGKEDRDSISSYNDNQEEE